MRLTAAQALVRFLAAQHVERDGVEHRFFAGCFGIFGHGNVAGIGQALYESPELLTYYQARNEQAMVHAAAGYARMQQPARDARLHDVDRPGRDEHGHRRGARDGQPAAGAARCRATSSPRAGRTRCCSSSRCRRRGDVSVNDCFRPVSRYFDRITRPEQVMPGGAAGDARARRPGRDRRGHARVPAGRAGRGVRLSRRVLRASASGTSRARCPTPTSLAAQRSS